MQVAVSKSSISKGCESCTGASARYTDTYYLIRIGTYRKPHSVAVVGIADMRLKINMWGSAISRLAMQSGPDLCLPSTSARMKRGTVDLCVLRSCGSLENAEADGLLSDKYAILLHRPMISLTFSEKVRQFPKLLGLPLEFAIVGVR
eukprot:1795407-Pleurochrysis_carterae.AAC.2